MVVSVAYGKKECYRIRVPNETPSIIRYVVHAALFPSYSIIIAIVVILMILASFLSISFTLLITPPFHHHSPTTKNKKNSGNFDLLDDEVDGSYITAWITKVAGYRGVGGTVWHSEEDEHEEDFVVHVDPVGAYDLCFELQTDPNNDEYAESYDVGFHLRLDPSVERTLEDAEQGPDAKKAMEVIDSARSVETTWHNLVDHYIYLRNRDAVAVELSQKIQDRVIGWTILEAILVIVMAVGQVLYWKKFFETRRYL